MLTGSWVQIYINDHVNVIDYFLTYLYHYRIIIRGIGKSPKIITFKDMLLVLLLWLTSFKLLTKPLLSQIYFFICQMRITPSTKIYGILIICQELCWYLIMLLFSSFTKLSTIVTQSKGGKITWTRLLLYGPRVPYQIWWFVLIYLILNLLSS